MTEVVELARQLVDIPSVTGEEKEVGEFLLESLEKRGWECRGQPVSVERFNVFAVRGQPEILLTTHIDTVPPFFTSSEDEDFLYGRGACDAKGIAAAMICAAQELIGEGEKNLGLLFVVGEETDSAGARKAGELGFQCTYFIDGEPTDNQLVVGHKGGVIVRLRALGRTAHSAYPERGESAIEKLLDVLERVRKISFPEDELLGKSFVNIGALRGGRAVNVIPDQAEAEVMLRTVTGTRVYVEQLQQALAGQAEMEVLREGDPQTMRSVEGFSTRVVGYGTDIAPLRSLGEPLLFGPGSILDAHTATEKISKTELNAAVGFYKTLVRKLKSELTG